MLLLEPQTWDTYAKAKRMDRVGVVYICFYTLILIIDAQRLKENAKNLKLRPDDFESILCNIGFGPAQHLGTTGEGGGFIHSQMLTR